MQHSLVEHDSLLCLRDMKAFFPAGEPILPCAQSTWARRFQQVLDRLGVPRGTFTLGSIRGGAATDEYERSENVPKIQFHRDYEEQKLIIVSFIKYVSCPKDSVSKKTYLVSK